jgi:hypothetical protein
MAELHSEDIVWYYSKNKLVGGWGTHYHVHDCSQVDKTYVGIRYQELMNKTFTYHGEKYVPCHCIAEYY